MEVLRVETRAGRGPYVRRGYGTQLHDMADAHTDWYSDCEAHPSPSEDINPETGEPLFEEDEWLESDEVDKYFCGFVSKEQGRAWFKGWRSVLARNKMLVSVYEVDPEDVRVGVRQLVFRKDKAVLLRQGTISAMM